MINSTQNVDENSPTIEGLVMGSDPSCPEQTSKTGGLPSRSPQTSDSARFDTSEEDAILKDDHQ
ncbi:hypothetical protein J6590_050910 [Homalodisca vitripennis]|nr:hypothetical protein J6590_050910 [Homalodisca vitripennis]